jgi:hypothetical protein
MIVRALAVAHGHFTHLHATFGKAYVAYELMEWRKGMRSVVVVALMILGSDAFGQTCLRPEWGKCVSFPNGGSHSGVSIQGMPVQMEVTPGPDICVSNQEEIGSGTYARFERNKTPWPNADWGVNADNYCFYQK